MICGMGLGGCKYGWGVVGGMWLYLKDMWVGFNGLDGFGYTYRICGWDGVGWGFSYTNRIIMWCG